MAGTQIPWPVTARLHNNAQLTGEHQGDLLNVYAFKSGDVIQWKRAPGLKRFTSSRNEASRRIPRGTLMVDNYILAGWDDGLEAVTANGTVIPLTGTVAGTDPLIMARNLRNIPEIAIVTESGSYLANLDTMTVVPYPLTDVSEAQDGSEMVDVLGAVNSVDYYNGYFIFTRPNGDIVASDLQSANIPELSDDKAQAAADGALRVLNNGETVLIFGTSTIEVWADVGKSPFPLARSTVIPVGLLGPYAVAGGPAVWERGVLFVASDFTVRQMDGYTPQIVSNEAVSRDIMDARFEADQIMAQVYVFNSHAIFSLTHPDWCWEYNLTTGSWHRRRSLTDTTWRAGFACNFAQRWLAQDWKKDGLLEIDPDTYHEDGDRLLAMLTSAPLKDFPISVRVPTLYFDFEVGMGRVDAAGVEGADPGVMLSWSHDGGATWSNPLARSLGRQGQRSRLIDLRNTGRSSHRGIMLRWAITDPVDVTFRQTVASVVQASRPRQVKG